jgi:predicted RNA-binding protein
VGTADPAASLWRVEQGSPKIWVLTGSLDNFRATAEHDFRVIGMKERRRRLAEQVEKGDIIVFYVTGVQAFAGTVVVTSELYEDRSKLWPGKPGAPDPYPWRFQTAPVIILPEEEFVPAEELATELEHVRKWPPDHWHLAFQGQLRIIGESDAALLRERLSSTSTAATKTAAGSKA